MTISTLDRRAFLRKFRRPEKMEGRKGIFGKASPLMPHRGQELPMVAAPTAAVVINGGLDPYTGPWDYAQAAHLLRRTTFGVKKADLDQLLGMTVDEAVNLVLDIDDTPPPHPVNNYNNADDGIDDPDVPLGQPWVNAEYNNDLEGYRIESFRGWWVKLMIDQGPSIREKMTLFWHNHFATQTEALFWGKPNYEHNAMLREFALGNFKELTKRVTIDPMMLYYLNGFLNHKDAPDENYARELQELFTVGKDFGQGYSEDDVYQAARVLTGWRINFDNSTTYFSWQEHDTGDKQFSAYYGNTVINGSADGDAELDALLDMLFANDDTALHVCRDLYRWFIYYNITEEVEQDVIQPLSQIFRDNNYDIMPVVETLLKSEHFFDATNKGCFISTPIDHVVGSLRSFNLNIPGSTPWDEFVMLYVMNAFMADMQMIPGDPPNVAGWQAFRQSPQYYRMWINGDTARNRNQFTDILSYGAFETENDQLGIDHIAFASQFDAPEDPVQYVEDLAQLLLPQPISDAKKLQLKNYLLSGLPNDGYWTTAWFDYQTNPDDPMSFEVVNVRLFFLHTRIMNLAEYQLA